MNKKVFIVFLALIIVPVFASATIDKNLYYGMAGDSQVKELQSFLINKGFLSGPITGNFYSLTLNAVKKYQVSKKITATGTVGPLTRKAITDDLAKPNQNYAPTTVAPTITNTNTTTAADKKFSGTLDLAANSKYPSQTVSVPRVALKLSDFTLTNKTTETINLTKVEVDSVFAPDLHISNQYLSNLYVICGENKTAIQKDVSFNNYFTVDCSIPVSGTINLSVFADIASQIPESYITKTGMLVSGISADSKTQVYSNSNVVLPGQNITFKTGYLTISSETIGSLPKIIAASQKIDGALFKFASTGDSFIISELKFTLLNNNFPPIISSIEIKDPDTKNILASGVVPASYNGKYFFNFTGLSIPVDMNSSKSLIISCNLGNVSSSENTNINIAPILVYVKAKNSKGEFIDGFSSDYSLNLSSSFGGIMIPSQGVKGADIFVYKTFPSFIADSKASSMSSDSVADIYTFQIKAEDKGDISIKQITFLITISDPNQIFPALKDFLFFKGGLDYSGKISIGEIINNAYVYPSSTNGIGFGTHKMILIFNNEEIIPAGTSLTYTLKAKLNNFIKSASVSTYILSDSAVSTNGNYLRSLFTPVFGLVPEQSSGSIVYYNLLWSDRAALGFPAHSDKNGYSTKDWYNGYGVYNSSLTQTINAK